MLNIVFQNEQFILVDKPVGWLSVPSRMGLADKRPVVGIELSIKIARRIWPVHRLDEDVSGLLLFALKPTSHSSANGWFERHDVTKTYEAFTHTEANEHARIFENQSWTCRLMRGKKRAYEASFGKDSITIARYQGIHTAASVPVGVWHLQPQTGRSHQLRYEMQRHGLPILGDTLYGSSAPWIAGGIALRAVRLDFSRCAGHSDFGLPPIISLPSLAPMPSFLVNNCD